MKSRTLIFATAMTLLVVLAMPLPLAAQDSKAQAKAPSHHHYQLIDMGTFGGPSSYLNALSDGGFNGTAKVLNRRGIIAGWADTPTQDPFPGFCFNPDCYVSHAFRWHGGSLTDLGTLAAGWSSAATWISDTGQIAGISQNGVIDPLIGFPEERAVLWQNGSMMDLGTLGGNQSAALGVNNHGQVAGLALNTIPDPFSIYDFLLYGSSNGTQTRAVLWDRNGRMQDLGTLGGPDAYAALVNEHGQVTGWSYTNSSPNPITGLPTFHPFLWGSGKGMQDLGTLGGTVAQAVNGLNESGEVAGSTTLAGDLTHHPFLWDGKRLIDLGTFGGDNGEADWVNDAGEVVGIAQLPVFCANGLGGHAFLWRNGVLNDLGTTDGLANSEAVYINSSGQTVGYSFACDFSSLDAFLWERGSIVDLNTLIPPNSPFHLWTALFIDDTGKITAFGLLTNGDQHAVLLIPCDEHHPGLEGCDYSLVEGSATGPETNPSVRNPSSRTVPQSLMRRMSRYHFPGLPFRPRN
jgi:probable HAF family extracellular repeat protein